MGSTPTPLAGVTQIIGEFDVVLVRVFVWQGIAEGFAFPVPDGFFADRVDDAARGVEVVGVDVVELRAGQAAVDRLQGGDRGVTDQPALQPLQIIWLCLQTLWYWPAALPENQYRSGLRAGICCRRLPDARRRVCICGIAICCEEALP